MENRSFDAIVAGAGIWGCTLARRLAEAGKKVLVLEKRAAVGGNCRCEIDPETGIEVHTYGSHIFHTSNEAVWKFVRRFTEFNSYTHSVLACTKKTGAENRSTADGSYLYHLPIGKTLLEEFFGVSMKDKNLNEFLAEHVDAVASPRQKEDGDVLVGRGKDSASTGGRGKDSASTGASRTYGDAIFDAFIRGYTSKQWGVAPEKVDPSIIARLKVRDNYSTDYFDDPHQGIPADGYNKMFERMLDHPNIEVRCGCELVIEKIGGESRSTADGLVSDCEERYQVKVRGEGAEELNKFLCPPTFSTYSLSIYYSGPIDALFNYKYGALPWRTLRFERETLPVADYQGNSVVNYTDAEVPFTRIHEFKHYHPEWAVGDVVVRGGSREEVGVCSCSGRKEESILHSTTTNYNSSPLHSTTTTNHYNSSRTVIMREYSAAWQPGDEPYYPIDNADSRALLAKYQEEADGINGAFRRNAPTGESPCFLTIGGRLGGYRYFDMDKSIAAALAVEI